MSLKEIEEFLDRNKTPVDKLSKEELIEIYGGAIHIAQRGAECQIGLQNHIAHLQDVLADKGKELTTLDEELIREIQLRTRAEDNLKSAREFISRLKDDSYSSDVKDVDVSETQQTPGIENPEQIQDISSELMPEYVAAKKKIRSLEIELFDVTSKLKEMNDLKDDFENMVSEKEEKIKLLQHTMEKKAEESDQCIEKLNAEIKRLEGAVLADEPLTRTMEQLKEVMDKQDEKMNKLRVNCHHLGRDVQGNTAISVNLLRDMAARDQDIKTKEESIADLKSELKDTQDKLTKSKMAQIECTSKMRKLQSENQQVSDKVSSLQTENAKLNNEVEEYKKKILNLKRETETCFAKQAEEVKSLQETINKGKESCENCEKRRGDLETEETVPNLQHDIERRDAQINDLALQLGELQNEVSEQRRLLEESKCMVAELNSQLETSRKQEKSAMESVDKLSAEKTSMALEIRRKDEEISLKENSVLKLSSELVEMGNQMNQLKLLSSEYSSRVDALQHENDCLSSECDDAKKQQECLSDLKAEVQDLHGKLAEKENLLKSMQEQKEADQCKIRVHEDLGQQINVLQDALRNKELVVQDLEQELSKLKDTVTNDTTNTEVSSTFSLSRTEELSRMKDLEDSFEDKYTKLRVVAVKLKKRVTELTQTLEGERSKSVTEKAELQAKLASLASHAKTVQTLQSEVDRLQDMLEEQKKNQQQLTKLLEAAVQESASKKFELVSVQEDLLRITNEKKNLEKSMSSLESSSADTDALRAEVDKLHKELKEKDFIMETCKEEKQKLAEQLEEICADAKKKSVLSLEMADMEKSVSKLTSELSSERDLLKKSRQEFEEEHSSFLSLSDKFKDVEGKLNEKERVCQELKDSLTVAKEEIDNLLSKCKDKESAVEQLCIQLEKQQAVIEELNIQCSDLAAKQVQTKESGRLQVEKLSRQIFQLEEQCSSLKESHSALEDELASVRTEFENYKVRAQSVLRQSAKQEDRTPSSGTVHNVEELEVEVEKLRVNISTLKANLHQTTSQLQAALQEVNIEREEKLRAIKQIQSSKESCAQAVERQHAAEERLSVVAEESKQARLQSDMLVQCYKQQIEDLKATHQKKIVSLTEQLETLQASITNPVTTHGEGDRSSSIQNGPSPVADWAAHLPSAAHSDSDLAMRLSSLQREDGEGSESVDSFPSRRVSVTTQDRRHELVPLDKLLSSTTYPEDDTRDVPRANSSDLNVDLLQSKLSACESRAAHLTALLSEAESDAARLSQLNTVLKEEIRRQQRCEERAQHAHNLEYLKNVVVKFITLQSGDERQRLVPVLNTILKLSPEEAGLVETAAKGASQTSSSGGWGSYLPLPGWTGS